MPSIKIARIRNVSSSSKKWSDPAALKQHFEVPASGAFVRALSTLAAEAPKMTIYQATELPGL